MGGIKCNVIWFETMILFPNSLTCRLSETLNELKKKAIIFITMEEEYQILKDNITWEIPLMTEMKLDPKTKCDKLDPDSKI